MPLERVGLKQLQDPYAEPYDFFSAHTGVNPFLFGDGSVRQVQSSISLGMLQGLATRAGGEVVSGEGF